MRAAGKAARRCWLGLPGEAAEDARNGRYESPEGNSLQWGRSLAPAPPFYHDAGGLGGLGLRSQAFTGVGAGVGRGARVRSAVTTLATADTMLASAAHMPGDRSRARRT